VIFPLYLWFFYKLKFFPSTDRELRTSAGCLLSLVAVCDAVCSAAPLVSVYFAWLAADFWAKQTTCFYALLPVVFLFSAMQVLLLELGLDRLLAVAFPIWRAFYNNNRL
jgi:hypothetical protein